MRSFQSLTKLPALFVILGLLLNFSFARADEPAYMDAQQVQRAVAALGSGKSVSALIKTDSAGIPHFSHVSGTVVSVSDESFQLATKSKHGAEVQTFAYRNVSEIHENTKVNARRLVLGLALVGAAFAAFEAWYRHSGS